MVFLGGIGWLLFVPLQPQQWIILAALLGAFSLYSGGLYALTFLRPARIRTYYLCVFIVDLLIITALNDYVGEVKGSFYLAYYLLVALHAYYFGLGMGLIVAGARLRSVCDVRLSRIPDHRVALNTRCGSPFSSWWPTFLGLLAEKDKGDKQHMEEPQSRAVGEDAQTGAGLHPTGRGPAADHSDRKAFLARDAGGRRRPRDQ